MIMEILGLVLAFVLAAFAGYFATLGVYYLLAKNWFYGYFFTRSLDYIRNNGRGHNLECNTYALEENLRNRIRSVHYVSFLVAISMSPLIYVLYEKTGSSLLLALAAIVGLSYGIYRLDSQSVLVESSATCCVGRLEMVEKEKFHAEFRTLDDHIIDVDYSEEERTGWTLYEGRSYYLCEFTWLSAIAGSDELEWEDGDWPEDAD